MRLAKSQLKEIQHIKKFLQECGWLNDELRHTDLEDVEFSEFELLKDFNKKDAGEFLSSVLNEIKSLHHEKAMWNLTTLIENCTDETLDYLDFSPKIKAGFEAVELLREINDYIDKSPSNNVGRFGSFDIKIKELLEKSPIENA